MADVTATQFQQDVNKASEWSNGDENTTVTMRLGQQARSPAKVINDIQNQADDAIRQAVNSFNLSPSGFDFATGGTLASNSQTVEDASGNDWVYTLEIPVGGYVVTAGTVPSSPDYKQVFYNSAEFVVFDDNQTVQVFKDETEASINSISTSVDELSDSLDEVKSPSAGSSGIIVLDSNSINTVKSINGVSLLRKGFRRGWQSQIPTGFNWDVLGLTFYIDDCGGTGSSIKIEDFDIASQNSPVNYFVEVGGTTQVSNDGTDPADPNGAINQVLLEIINNNVANAVVWVRPGLYADNIGWGTTSIINSNVSIKPWNGSTTAPFYDESGGRIVISTETTGLAWTDNGDGQVYFTTRSAVCSVVDSSQVDTSNNNLMYDKVTSLIDCVSTPASWFQDGSTLYVHTVNGNDPAGAISAFTSKINGICGEGNYTFYIDRCDFFGGQSSFQCRTTNANTNEVIFMHDCSLAYGLTNGLTTEGARYTIMYNTEAHDNAYDGFNYHEDTTDGSKQIYAIEYNSRGYNNGRDWSDLQGSNNGSTMHDGMTVARFGGVYYGNSGPNIADVGGGDSWLFNVHARDSRTPLISATNCDFYCSAGNMWLEHCDSTQTDSMYSVGGSGASIMARYCNLDPKVFAAQQLSSF